MAERPQGPDPARMTAGEAYMDGNADAFSESAAYLYGAASVSDGTARVALWRAAEVMQQRERDCRTAMRSRAEETFTHVPMRPYTEAEEAAENWPPDDDGVSGQDRKSYTDDQDRESYVVDGSPEGPDERLREQVEQACEVMHDAYEAAAVGAGWETQAASRKPWADVPEANKATMRAAVAALLAWLPRSPEGPDEGLREALVLALIDPWDVPCAQCGAAAYTACNGVESDAHWSRRADAVLPLLTAERERADALQRQVDAVRALCDRIDVSTWPVQSPRAVVMHFRAALSDPEGDDRD